MSVEHWFTANFTFEDQAAVRAAKHALQQEGYVDSRDNLLRDALVWDGLRLHVDAKGSMPYTSFEICEGVLSLLSSYAQRGEALAINIEDGIGTRYPAGRDAIELEDEEVDRLRHTYGWSAETMA